MISKPIAEWHPIAKLTYWICIVILITCVLALFSSPNGVLGSLSEKLFAALTPKYLTLIVNTFALVGAYVVIRLLLVFAIPWKNQGKETLGILGVIWVALTAMSLWGARCDIYVFCVDELTVRSDCEADWDKQGVHCQ